jgi:hypothetical protein
LLQKKNVADRYDRIDTYWDQTYAAAGIAVVGALKQMALSVGEQFAKAAFERIGGAAAGKFIDFLVETRGWKLITDKAGKVVKILSKEGTEIEATVMRHELAHAEAAYAKQFVLGIYKDVQGTRGVSAAHHGVMSAWMNGHYGKAYDKFLAPAIQMPEAFHETTKGLANAWMAETKKKMGGTLNWANIGFSEMKDLSEKMFDVAGVPASVRKRYWEAFNPFHERLQLP